MTSLLRPGGGSVARWISSASRVTVVGHSGGCTVATALAEQRPGVVAALALIDMGPPRTPRSLKAGSAVSC
jgi:pimeloyl-ACP methyl ester carboxylesterase